MPVRRAATSFLSPVVISLCICVLLVAARVGTLASQDSAGIGGVTSLDGGIQAQAPSCPDAAGTTTVSDVGTADGSPAPAAMAPAAECPPPVVLYPWGDVESAVFPTVADVDQSYSSTITIRNIGDAGGTFWLDCTPLSSQLNCGNVSPSTVFLKINWTATFTVQWSTRGTGPHSIKYTVNAAETDLMNPTDSIVRTIQVTGTPMIAHIKPTNQAHAAVGDSLFAAMNHSSGINAPSVVVKIDGATVGRSIVGDQIIVPSLPTLLGGSHTWYTYGCALSGRCESRQTTFQTLGPATVWQLDDSLPPPQGHGISPVLGGLPLPPEHLRGCPTEVSHPEIRITSPTSFLRQVGSTSAPGGLVFLGTVTMNDVLSISTATVDRRDTDPATCATYGYLDREDFDWTWWIGADSTDALWDYYPYGQLFTTAPILDDVQDYAVLGDPVGWQGASLSSTRVRGPSAGGLADGPVEWTRAWATRRSRAAPGAAEMPTSFPASLAAFLPDPGAIKTSSYRLTLNGVLLVDGGRAQNGADVVDLQRGGSTVTLPHNSALIRAYNPDNPAANYGGWNELIAPISDSGGRWSSVRTQFVHLGKGPVQPLALTPLRDFRHLDQGECAAFGAFQCGGVMLTQTIPGFVTRDRERALHLVYRSASQRAPVVLPVEVEIDRGQHAPDSLHVKLGVNGVMDPAISTRYAGTRGAVTGIGSTNLWENADEVRVLGAELAAPASVNASIRRATIAVTSHYLFDPAATDTISQQVVQVFLSDTTATRFGQGWQLAELSRLVLGLTWENQTAAVLTSGDGSYGVYLKPATTWVAPPGDASRLVSLGSPINGAYHVLYLENGARVGFRADGWQVWTEDLLGNRTLYTYESATSGRLMSINDVTGKKFLFRYAPNSPQVTSVVVQASASTSDTTLMATLEYFCPAGSAPCNTARLSKFRLWHATGSQDSTTYTYRTNDAYGAYVASVTDPRSTTAKPIVTSFTYDNTLRSPSGLTGPPGLSGATTMHFRDAIRRASPREGIGRGPGTALERLVYTNQLRGTLVDVGGRPTDYRVGRFGAPTWVRRISSGQAPNAGGFFIPSSAADDIRTIERDTAGRAIKIVRGSYTADPPDSVMYTYDAKSRVTMLRRTTLAFPKVLAGGGVAELDTLRFEYDTVALATNGAWCSRLLRSWDALKVPSTVTYGPPGVASCLPLRINGAANDTTVYTYGTLQAGITSGVRPLSVRDPNGLVESVTYHSATWNTATHVGSDGGTSRMYYNRLGRPDSIVDPAGAATRLEADWLGRVLRQKTGTGALAPTTRTWFGRGGLVDSVQVYASGNSTLQTPLDTMIQTTRYYYSALGHVDSLIGPGRRSTSGPGRARKQSWTRDTYGNPLYEYPGNGTFIARVYDWQGRPMFADHSQVNPAAPVGGERFADPATRLAYDSLQLGMGKQLSAGQAHNYYYDSKGRLSGTTSADVYRGGVFAQRSLVYSPVGAVTAETITFTDGVTVQRSFQYNRRGQRILARDSLVTTSAAPYVSGERVGELIYAYDSLTGRPTTLTSRTRDATTNAWTTASQISWTWDRGGRELTRSVLLGGTTVPVVTTTTYLSNGRVATVATARSGVLSYEFAKPVYSAIGDLTSFTERRRDLTGTRTLSYATDGTRRLLNTSDGASSHGYGWTHDVFGNRRTESHTRPDGCISNVTLSYGPDSRLVNQGSYPACGVKYGRHLTDQAGMRLATYDSLSGLAHVQAIMSYTAAGQLYFSLTPTASIGTYDYNWHWYDASGLRSVSHVSTANTIIQGAKPDSGWGLRTYYVYDGPDVALMLVKPFGGSTWRVQQRYASVGVDEVVAGRYWVNGSHQNLAIIGDRQGTTIRALKPDGTEETRAQLFDRNAYGALEGAVNGGATGEVNTGTGYTGASTPNATGGFTYLRNRWYDPATGRFLTQDPIGLAGGVNLYAYAGNNPVSFSDPFGLCWQLWRPECRTASSRFTMGDAVVGGAYFLAGSASVLGGAHARQTLATMLQTRNEAASLVADRRADDPSKWGAPQRNAFRHIFGACRLTRALGRTTAARVTNAHETTLRSGDKAQERDTTADMENNAIGMSAGESAGNAGESCEAIADAAIDGGNYSTGE